MESAICRICLLVLIMVSDFVTSVSRDFQFHIGLGVSRYWLFLRLKFWHQGVLDFMIDAGGWSCYQDAELVL